MVSGIEIHELSSRVYSIFNLVTSFCVHEIACSVPPCHFSPPIGEVVCTVGIKISIKPLVEKIKGNLASDIFIEILFARFFGKVQLYSPGAAFALLTIIVHVAPLSEENSRFTLSTLVECQV